MSKERRKTHVFVQPSTSMSLQTGDYPAVLRQGIFVFVGTDDGLSIDVETSIDQASAPTDF